MGGAIVNALVARGAVAKPPGVEAALSGDQNCSTVKPRESPQYFVNGGSSWSRSYFEM